MTTRRTFLKGAGGSWPYPSQHVDDYLFRQSFGKSKWGAADSGTKTGNRQRISRMRHVSLDLGQMTINSVIKDLPDDESRRLQI